jgi:hypothetical protein
VKERLAYSEAIVSAQVHIDDSRRNLIASDEFQGLGGIGCRNQAGPGGTKRGMQVERD